MPPQEGSRRVQNHRAQSHSHHGSQQRHRRSHRSPSCCPGASPRHRRAPDRSAGCIGRRVPGQWWLSTIPRAGRHLFERYERLRRVRHGRVRTDRSHRQQRGCHAAVATGRAQGGGMESHDRREYSRRAAWHGGGVATHADTGLRPGDQHVFHWRIGRIAQQLVRVRLEAVSLDSTIVKVHPDGTGARKKTARRPSAAPAEAGPPKFIWLPRIPAAR